MGNPEDLIDVTQRVQEYFLNAYKENAPEFIYFITLYNIFNDFLEEVNEDNLANEQIGLKDTVVWDKLYNFQRDAVIGAINKLEKYNGCILADSVGLGKTFGAGIIKYYEMRNKDVLVLCPKSSRPTGTPTATTTRTTSWPRIGLGTMSSSHRSFPRPRHKQRPQPRLRQLGQLWPDRHRRVPQLSEQQPIGERENRYQRLMRKVIQKGIETKVLMLSATPVNNRFNDLRNQLARLRRPRPNNGRQLETKSASTRFSAAPNRPSTPGAASKRKNAPRSACSTSSTSISSNCSMP